MQRKAENKGTTKEFFKESIDLERIQNAYGNKVSSLDSLLFDLDLKKFDELDLDEDQYNSVNAAYDFYQYKTGHKKKLPAKIFRLNPPIVNKLHDIDAIS